MNVLCRLSTFSRGCERGHVPPPACGSVRSGSGSGTRAGRKTMRKKQEIHSGKSFPKLTEHKPGARERHVDRSRIPDAHARPPVLRVPANLARRSITSVECGRNAPGRLGLLHTRASSVMLMLKISRDLQYNVFVFSLIILNLQRNANNTKQRSLRRGPDWGNEAVLCMSAGTHARKVDSCTARTARPRNEQHPARGPVETEGKQKPFNAPRRPAA